MTNNYANICVLSTYGIIEQELGLIKKTLAAQEVELSYSEKEGEGRLCLAKVNVDSIAIQRALEKVMMIIGDKVYADEDISLAEVAVSRLAKRGYIISTAESVTGGMLASSICDIEGASKVFYEGLVTYNSGAKVRRLHVPASSIDKYSAVSKQVCDAMLEGILTSKEINIAIATTGYASGTQKQEGTAFVGIGDKTNKVVQECKFAGTRNSIRRQIVNKALFMLIRLLDN